MSGGKVGRPLLRVSWQSQRTGLNGIGLPTRLDIPRQTALRVAGESVADESLHDQRIDDLNINLANLSGGASDASRSRGDLASPRQRDCAIGVWLYGVSDERKMPPSREE